MAVEDKEDQFFQEDVRAVKKWWSCSRWKYTKRPFTAEQIVAKRGNLMIQYPSNDMSKKLWDIVEARFKVPMFVTKSWLDTYTVPKNRDVSFTYGCLEPTMLTQMAKYLETVYVSGWQCSSTASSTDEPSPDLADYPMVRTIHDMKEKRVRLPYTEYCPEQSSPTLPSSALSRPKAARRADLDTKSKSRQRCKHRLFEAHHRRRRHWSRRSHSYHEVDQALHRERRRGNSYRRSGARNEEVRSYGWQGPRTDQ